MNCISCKYPLEKYTETSYLNLPSYKCKNCGLIVTGDSEEKILDNTIKIYKEKHWGKGKLWDAEKITKFNYNDIDSQGKKRTWISQFKYCENYFKDKKKLLEIGSGQGQSTWWFEERGFDVVGIEPDQNNVVLINQKLKYGKCIVGSAEDFNILEKFDIIWMSHVLEHIVKLEQFLKKIKINLNPNGIFFLEVPNCGNSKTLQTSIHSVPHTFHFTQKSLKNIVKNNGYEIIKTDFFRPATKSEGLIQKISKKHKFYPRILTNEKDGIFLRMLIK